MAWRAKSKPVNHEAESAYVTGEGGAAENVMKFSEICVPGLVSLPLSVTLMYLL